jgi:hypothetical protein
MMTDEQLANYLHLRPEEAAIIIPKSAVAVVRRAPRTSAR